MLGMGEGACPFECNTDPASDAVGHRVTGSLEGMPFADVLLEVHEDHAVLTSDVDDSNATREGRPSVSEEDVC